MWQITDNEQAFTAWLAEIYGEGELPPPYDSISMIADPKPLQWVSYNDFWPKLFQWQLKDFDASRLMDQWTFNDSYWNNFISYADVIQKGIPKAYKVLILSDTLCLSDAEARKIKAFCRAGGTVIADYMPGLWDQHGKGRPAAPWTTCSAYDTYSHT